MKNIQIFKDTSKKTSITLPDFKENSIFERFFATNQEDNFSKTDDTMTDKPRLTKNSKSQSDHALKPIAKGKKRENLRQKQQKTFFISNFIIQLSKLHETNWEELANTKAVVTNCSENDEENKFTNTDLDLYKILVTKLIFKANT